ncbi:hypothetical protein NYZ25_19910, partial [Acinetobacter baumannii]|nr:hypothetical protein [Acinetobacter baumannii]
MQALYASHYRLVRKPLDAQAAPAPYEGWQLETGSRLPTYPITSGGRSIGWLLGWPTNLRPSALNLPAVNDQSLTDLVHALSGRFVVIV